VLRPAEREEPGVGFLVRSTLQLIAVGAVAMIVAQALAVAVQLGALVDESGWPLSDITATAYFRTSLVKAMLCGLVVAGAVALRRREERSGGWMVLIGLAVLLASAVAWTSHAAARLEHRAPLLALDTLHQLAAAVWVGGLLHLIAMAAREREYYPWRIAILRRFSAMSLGAVALLVASGFGLSLYYIGRLGALVGTGYGLMVLTKVVVLGELCGLGAMNFLAVRKLQASQESVSRELTWITRQRSW